MSLTLFIALSAVILGIVIGYVLHNFIEIHARKSDKLPQTGAWIPPDLPVKSVTTPDNSPDGADERIIYLTEDHEDEVAEELLREK